MQTQYTGGRSSRWTDSCPHPVLWCSQAVWNNQSCPWSSGNTVIACAILALDYLRILFLRLTRLCCWFPSHSFDYYISTSFNKHLWSIYIALTEGHSHAQFCGSVHEWIRWPSAHRPWGSRTKARSARILGSLLPPASATLGGLRASSPVLSSAVLLWKGFSVMASIIQLYSQSYFLIWGEAWNL